MNRIHTTLSAAILALAGSVAFANEEAHKPQAADSHSAPMAQGQHAPQGQDLDTNAQRAHDPSSKAGADAAANTDDSMGTGTPSVQDLDTNAQRAHQPEGGAAGGANAGVEAGGSSGSSGEASGGASAGADASVSGGGAAASGETRDWSQIDANNDNLIGADEMERALEATGPQAGGQDQQQQSEPQQQSDQQQPAQR